jgi:hypothetical protein
MMQQFFYCFTYKYSYVFNASCIDHHHVVLFLPFKTVFYILPILRSLEPYTSHVHTTTCAISSEKSPPLVTKMTLSELFCMHSPSFIVASLFSPSNTEQAGENHVILYHTTQMNDV